ncbi:hypothetical protein P170DRAFT_473560 [Aspergillus steynii IBT 23096]|uniref:Lysine-specific metallo-endopeptidase domain-containing protein n=1 Tax=Aspergillus steynii IBT 23096 TaxID=1392250 RepID=A0A2I2GAT8_9EURO|nr:uncharacterized protein P170DRAFT_473560 [Aspergillus steynii IBT 23096]PLB49989.1 hypothetical protein P170DRAFT_473560 [Aspergillus steynii IBT 23096]
MVRLNWGAALCIVPSLASSVAGSVIPDHGEFNTLSRRAMPQFNGFESKPERKERIVQSLKDMVTMVTKVMDALYSEEAADKKIVNAVLGQYFTEDQQGTALEVIKALVEPAHIDGTTGSDVMQMVQFNAEDFDKACMPGKDQKVWSNKIAWGYTKPRTSPSEIHFCDSKRRDAYKYPDLDSMTCLDVGSQVSWKMLPLAYVTIHELTHAIDISGPILEPLCLGEYTKDPAYGPELTRELRKNPDNEKYKALFDKMSPLQNADSYAWFVTEAYWALTCGRTFGAPTSNRNYYDGVCKDSALNKAMCFASSMNIS